MRVPRSAIRVLLGAGTVIATAPSALGRLVFGGVANDVDSKTLSTVPLRSRWSRAHAELFARSNLPAVRVVPVRVAKARGCSLGGGDQRECQRAGAARTARQRPERAAMRFDDAACNRQR